MSITSSGRDIRLIMTRGEWAYRAQHIPSSLHFSTPEQGIKTLGSNDDIVVYCSDEASIASRAACQFWGAHGFKRVRRYAGGRNDWEDAGYPPERKRVG